MEAASGRSLSRAATTLALLLGQSLYYARHLHDSFNKQTFPGGQLGTRDVAVTAVDMTALSSHLCLSQSHGPVTLPSIQRKERELRERPGPRDPQ